MAKNAGKTTALNCLIEEAYDEGMVIGLTSSGRDGESCDLVTGSEKPKIYAFESTLVSVPVGLYDLADAGLEIIRRTAYSTPLGDILLCRVRESGYVQIAGPLQVKNHKAMCEEMLAEGVGMVLVDGAIDRRSVASPDMSDGIILATGAVLSRSIKEVVKETAYVAGLYHLPVLSDANVRRAVESEPDDRKILLIKDENRPVQPLDLQTGLGAGWYLDEAIQESVRYVYLPGALTCSVLADIHPDKYRRTQFIVKDPTKIFIDRLTWNQLAKRGFRVQTLRSIRIAAITVNPYSPLGWSLDPGRLLAEMQAAMADFTVTDVRAGSVTSRYDEEEEAEPDLGRKEL